MTSDLTKYKSEFLQLYFREVTSSQMFRKRVPKLFQK